MDKSSSQVIRSKKPHQRQPFQMAITTESQRLDVEFLGKPVQLLNHDEMEEWFEGQRELWQENY